MKWALYQEKNADDDEEQHKNIELPMLQEKELEWKLSM